MKTYKRLFTRIESAREFSRGKSNSGYNVGAEPKVNDDKTTWIIYWGAGFLDPKAAMEE